MGNAGIRKAISALGWAYCWAIVRKSVDHDPTVEEVADWWNQSHRTAYRNQAAFRKAFPTLENPAKIYGDPDIRAKMRQTAQAADALDAKISSRRPSLPDLAILQLGMLPAKA